MHLSLGSARPEAAPACQCPPVRLPLAEQHDALHCPTHWSLRKGPGQGVSACCASPAFMLSLHLSLMHTLYVLASQAAASLAPILCLMPLQPTACCTAPPLTGHPVSGHGSANRLCGPSGPVQARTEVECVTQVLQLHLCSPHLHSPLYHRH